MMIKIVFVEVIDNAEITVEIVQSKLFDDAIKVRCDYLKILARTSGLRTRERITYLHSNLFRFLDAFLNKATQIPCQLLHESSEFHEQKRQKGIWNIPSRITLLKGTRANNIFSDAALKSWFIRINKSTDF